MKLPPKKKWKPIAWVLDDGIIFDVNHRFLLASVFHRELDRLREEWLMQEGGVS